MLESKDRLNDAESALQFTPKNPCHLSQLFRLGLKKKKCERNFKNFDHQNLDEQEI